MALSYVDAISRALQEYDTGTAVPLDGQPLQIYKDLAWGGLWMTAPYNALPIEDRTRIDGVIEAENTGQPYTNANGQTFIPKSVPCN